MASQEPKSWTTTLLLNILLPWVGLCGIHRFYSGHIVIGLIQLLTYGFCGIWQVVDMILILVGSYTDAKGNPLVK